ncbi:hypothetical protein Ahy_A07g037222 [Arachis hypogaea]|uniref:Uncharacterized protein n=1 Tax=Arachis hypogaea TaxID=3818 RepID=A0A445CI47_ARAHY|nr:hypothetical protein Ahy_A07g037222 [Arachis hypogaea]
MRQDSRCHDQEDLQPMNGLAAIDEGFKHRCLTNRANKVSAKSSKYIGESATFMKTKVRLSKSLSRDTMMAETFKYTHTLNENKENLLINDVWIIM